MLADLILFPFIRGLDELAPTERDSVHRSWGLIASAVGAACISGILAYVGYRLTSWNVQLAAFLMMAVAVGMWWAGMFIRLRVFWRAQRRRKADRASVTQYLDKAKHDVARNE